MMITNTHTGDFIEVGTLPNRKKPCLFYGSGNKAVYAAAFRNAEEARAFENFLLKFLRDLEQGEE